MKRHGQGRILRSKARLVAKGCSQTTGIYFSKVVSTVSKYTTSRKTFAISVLFGWRQRLLDVKNAFVNAPLIGKPYITQPKVFERNGCE